MFRRTPKPVTLTDDIRVTRKSGIRTAILVTLLVSGIVPAFSMFWGGQEGVPFTSHLSKLASVVLHTYPLTVAIAVITLCLLYTSPSPRDATLSRMPSSA